MQLTIRGMSKQVEQAIRKLSRKEGISLNRAVLRLLERALGRPSPAGDAQIQDDLDRFCGLWSEEEAEEIEGRLSQVRSVDRELWP